MSYIIELIREPKIGDEIIHITEVGNFVYTLKHIDEAEQRPISMDVRFEEGGKNETKA